MPMCFIVYQTSELWLKNGDKITIMKDHIIRWDMFHQSNLFSPFPKITKTTKNQ